MGNRLTNEVFLVGAMKTNLRGAICPEANPPRAERVLWPGRNFFFGNGRLPSGVFYLIHNAEAARGRLPVILANGDIVANGWLARNAHF